MRLLTPLSYLLVLGTERVAAQQDLPDATQLDLAAIAAAGPPPSFPGATSLGNTWIGSRVSPENGLSKRNEECTPYEPTNPTVAGPLIDTADAFTSYAPFAQAANAATTPPGYLNTFTNLNAENLALGFMGSSVLAVYDPSSCSALCDAHNECAAFNIAFERVPVLNPGPDCPNPNSTAWVKCTLWGGPVNVGNAINTGQWRNGFQVVSAGSNGYVNNTIDDCPGYDGPNYLSEAAIDAPLDCHGQSTFLGSQYWNDGAPFDAQRCASACSNITDCKFFNTYVINVDWQAQGQYCAMYSQSWEGSYATNTGGPFQGSQYTVTYSYSFSNSTDAGVCSAGNTTLLGCYHDQGSPRALEYRMWGDNQMTVEECSNLCSNFTYFGIEYGGECYCDNSMALANQYGKSDNCIMGCNGNPSEACGGGWAIDIYSQGVATSPSTTSISSTPATSTSTSALSTGTTTTTSSSAPTDSSAVSTSTTDGTSSTSSSTDSLGISTTATTSFSTSILTSTSSFDSSTSTSAPISDYSSSISAPSFSSSFSTSMSFSDTSFSTLAPSSALSSPGASSASLSNVATSTSLQMSSTSASNDASVASTTTQSASTSSVISSSSSFTTIRTRHSKGSKATPIPTPIYSPSSNTGSSRITPIPTPIYSTSSTRKSSRATPIPTPIYSPSSNTRSSRITPIPTPIYSSSTRKNSRATPIPTPVSSSSTAVYPMPTYHPTPTPTAYLTPTVNPTPTNTPYPTPNPHPTPKPTSRSCIQWYVPDSVPIALKRDVHMDLDIKNGERGYIAPNLGSLDDRTFAKLNQPAADSHLSQFENREVYRPELLCTTPIYYPYSPVLYTPMPAPSTTYVPATSTYYVPTPGSTPRASCAFPGVCGTYQQCNPVADCYCGSNAADRTICFQDESCATAPSCSSDAECGSGYACLVSSCCGGPVCAAVSVCRNPGFRKRPRAIFTGDTSDWTMISPPQSLIPALSSGYPPQNPPW